MNDQKIAILTDSCADLSPQAIAGHPIFVVPLIIRCQDGDYRDGVDIFARDIYARLATELPKTSLPSGESVEQALVQIQAQGYEKVIAIMLSSGLSGTYNLIRLAGEHFPGLEIAVYDSLSGSLGAGAMVLQTADYLAQGMDWTQLCARVSGLVANTHPFFSVDTLEYLQKGGRIGKVTALAGAMLQIKPILTFAPDGQLISAAKARGRRQVEDKLVEQVRRFWRPGCRYNLAVAHGGNPEGYGPLKARLLREFPDFVHLYEGEIDATLSVYIGPGVLGAGIQLLEE